MKKNIYSDIYEGGNMMSFVAESVAKNSGLYMQIVQEDQYKYDYFMPVELRIILKYINDEFDKYEFEGSPMFDELPDKRFIDDIVEKIMKKYIDNEKDNSFFVDKNAKLLIYALVTGVIVYRRNRHAYIKNMLS